MQLFEVISWVALGALLGVGQLYLHRREQLAERIGARTVAIGAAAGLAGGALGRLATGEGGILGGYSIIALFLCGAVAGMALGASWTKGRARP